MPGLEGDREQTTLDDPSVVRRSVVSDQTLAEIFSILCSSGLPQAELGKLLNLSSRDISRLCRRLEAKGLIARHRILFGTRFTYLLRSTSNLDLDSLREYLVKKPSAPSMNFVSPDLSPRIRTAVDLRRNGLSVREIASEMNVSIDTAESYLHYARRPEQYYQSKEKSYERSRRVDPDAVAFVLERLSTKGYLCTTNLEGLDKGKFRRAAEFLRNQGVARMAVFPQQWKYFGDLASQIIVYVNSSEAVDFISSHIDSVVRDWTLRRKRGVEGKGYDSVSTFKSAVSIRLKDVLMNPGIYHSIRERMGANVEN